MKNNQNWSADGGLYGFVRGFSGVYIEFFDRSIGGHILGLISIRVVLSGGWSTLYTFWLGSSLTVWKGISNSTIVIYNKACKLRVDKKKVKYVFSSSTLTQN